MVSQINLHDRNLILKCKRIRQMKKYQLVLGMCIITSFSSITIAKNECCVDQCDHTKDLTKEQLSACGDGCGFLSGLSDQKNATEKCAKKKLKKDRIKKDYPVAECFKGVRYAFLCTG